MKKLLIIGAGGMGRTFFDFVKECVGYNVDFEIKGFLDDNVNQLDGFDGYPMVIDTIKDYQPQSGDVFTCSIGSEIRKKCIETILGKGGKFISLIHNTARIGTGIKIGKGISISAFSTIAANSEIGDYNFIQSNVIIGHDVKLGDWNRIDSNVLCVGGVEIGNENCIHTSSVINHNVKIENCTKIAACSFVIKDVKSGETVFGNPARRLK